MVITLDKRKRPLGWCTPARASGLLRKKRAVVYRMYPFVIILKDKDSRTEEISHRYRIKIDPGALTTGVAVIEDDKVILFTQIEHRGTQVVSNLLTRKNIRMNRRSRETEYRHCKFPKGNAPTSRQKGWLPPSQLSIADNVINYVNKLIRFLGPCDVSIEWVKFDTQKIQNPEISGVEYQQGTLFGYEIKEYLLEKYQHTCQYCKGETGDRRLEREHKLPRSRGGSDRVDNATLACHTCNQEKDNLTPEEWLQNIQQKQSASDLDKIRVECLKNVIAGKKNGQSLRYASWVNNTRKYLVNRIQSLRGVLSTELSTGGRTVFNRKKFGLAKDHHLDALCVGTLNPEQGYRFVNQPFLVMKAYGRGSRLRGNLNCCGVITTKYTSRRKRFYGFCTGDIVRAKIPRGKYKGTWVGRVNTRNRKTFALKPFSNKIFDVNVDYITILQQNDGYNYSWATNSPMRLKPQDHLADS